ncbi:MAG: hypothetical protein A3H32_21135 [Betaproteobacteria bacterium RIFCSPLOWO2_02_FULL_63_19]|nr:MAG: hypothetical protein A3H32_21135 [Betaproteobacteria bacterium RIFCSPLOWO2_02_FULL_63_19]
MNPNRKRQYRWNFAGFSGEGLRVGLVMLDLDHALAAPKRVIFRLVQFSTHPVSDQRRAT